MHAGIFALAASALADIGGVAWLNRPLADVGDRLHIGVASLLRTFDNGAEPRSIGDFLADPKTHATFSTLTPAERAVALPAILSALCDLAGTTPPALHAAPFPRHGTRDELLAWGRAHGVFGALVDTMRLEIAATSVRRSPARQQIYVVSPIDALTTDPARAVSGDRLTGPALRAAREILYRRLDAMAAGAAQFDGLPLSSAPLGDGRNAKPALALIAQLSIVRIGKATSACTKRFSPFNTV